MFQSNQEQFTSPARVLHLDRHQTITHLEILGCKRGDAVYIRAFLPKEDPRYGPGTGRKADKLNWEQVERWQTEGYGIYIVANGGGHKDEDVQRCRAIFCEFDDRPIEDQISFWQNLGLPEPSLQIATRKSVHTYWVFDKPISVEQWRELQVALLSYTGSDQSLKNPSRVMRLAGAYHIKPGCEPVRCDIIHQSSKRYCHEELRAAIPTPLPSVQPELQTLPQAEPEFQPVSTATKYQRYEDIQVPVSESVPLYQCLSKESRTLIDAGIGEGGRNTGGAKLARDLIGTASYLHTIGQLFDGHPRQLLDDYASRCTPPLLGIEVDAIWKSAEKGQPGPSCKAEGVEACIRGWYWNNYILPNHRNHSSSKQPGQGFGDNSSNGSGNQAPIAAVSLVDRIRDILNRYEQESLQVNALIDLGTATGRTFNEINQLAKIIRAEGELADEVIEAVKSFRGILNSCRKRLDIHRYLGPALAHALAAKAGAMPTAPEYLFNTLLCASASRIGTAARVIINPEGGYKQPCVLWTANVAHSGQAKTPPQKEIIDPLEEMEAEASVLYDVQVKNYEQDDDKNAPTPVRQRRILNNVTSSTKIRLHAQNPRGLLEYIDELVADYSRLNQYKAGKGDDLQLELGFWNGASVSYDRHDAQLFLKRTGFSKTGTYQWDTLARLMTDETNFIASGYSARFLYCSVLDAPPRYLDLLSAGGDNTLYQMLGWLYGELEKQPEVDYLLSHEAKVLFQGWNHALVNAEIEESHYGLSLVYAKIEANTARIALWLHIVNAVLRSERPAPVISGETMQHAIEIGSFYLWQHKLIHAHNSPTRKLEGIFLKVQTQAEKFFAKCGKGVGASFLKTRVNALKGWVVEKIRSTVFKTLAAAGHGRIEGEGAEMVYIPSTVPTDPSGRGLEERGYGIGGKGEEDSSVSPLTLPPSPSSCSLAQELAPPVGGVGGELVVSPNAESIANTDVLSSVGEVGVQYPPNLSSSQPVPVLELDSDSQALHQFTNNKAETHAFTELTLAGGTTNPSPIPPTTSGTPQQTSTPQDVSALILQCQTWVELAQAVGQNTQKLLQAANRITTEQRRGLASLLAAHLCQNPEHLSQLAWVPAKLRDRALERLTFTLRRIGGAANVLDAYIESISGYKFVAVEHLGTRNEQWVFQLEEGNRLAVFGVDAIEAIAYGVAG